jgi:hypothetical protein
VRHTCAPICWMCGASFSAPSTRALTSVEPSTSMLVVPLRARTALLGVFLVHGELLRKLASDAVLAGASVGTRAQHTCNSAKAAATQSTRMARCVTICDVTYHHFCLKKQHCSILIDVTCTRMASTVLVCCCGLPAAGNDCVYENMHLDLVADCVCAPLVINHAGKSSVCRELAKQSSAHSARVWHICYDDFINVSTMQYYIMQSCLRNNGSSFKTASDPCVCHSTLGIGRDARQEV